MARYPTDIDDVPPAATESDAVSIAERYIDRIGDVEAFVDVARAAFCRGQDLPDAGDPVHFDALDRVERRARNTWHDRETRQRREAGV